MRGRLVFPVALVMIRSRNDLARPPLLVCRPRDTHNRPAPHNEYAPGVALSSNANTGDRPLCAGANCGPRLARPVPRATPRSTRSADTRDSLPPVIAIERPARNASAPALSRAGSVPSIGGTRPNGDILPRVFYGVKKSQRESPRRAAPAPELLCAQYGASAPCTLPQPRHSGWRGRATVARGQAGPHIRTAALQERAR